MNFFTKFRKSILNKSLVIYKNNSRIIRSKTQNWEKKFLSEFKEYAYEFILFLESRKGFWFKILCLLIMFRPSLLRLYYIFGGEHDKMLQNHYILRDMDIYQKDNLVPHQADNRNINKILYSYWTNYL